MIISRVSHRVTHCSGQLSEEMMGGLWAAGGRHEPTCLVEGLALKQMLFSPLTLFLGLLDPFF